MRVFELLAQLKDRDPNSPVMVQSDKDPKRLHELIRVKTVDKPISNGSEIYKRFTVLEK